MTSKALLAKRKQAREDIRLLKLNPCRFHLTNGTISVAPENVETLQHLCDYFNYPFHVITVDGPSLD